MKLWPLWLFIRAIQPFHTLNPLDLSCKRREYRLITNQSKYVIASDNPVITVQATIGFDDQRISPSLTELWYEQAYQQSLTLQSSEQLFKIDGEFNKNQTNSWNFELSSTLNNSNFPFYPNSILNIQSTLFNKQLDLIIQTNEDGSCSYPDSSIDFGICCGLCSTTNTCSDIKILDEHSRYDIIVTNRGLMVPRSSTQFRGNFICSLLHSTIISQKFPNIFIEQILNQTFALGRTFEEYMLNDTQSINQWHMINTKNVEQVLDRCLLQNLNQNIHRPSLIYIRPTTTYSLVNHDRYVTKNYHFLLKSDYPFNDNDEYLIASSFDNRKSIIYQEFIHNQLSCYLPLIRTKTFITKCLTYSIIRPRFKQNSGFARLIPIEPLKNLQLNRYQAGSNSVIVYNLENHKAKIFFLTSIESLNRRTVKACACEYKTRICLCQ